MEESSIYAIIKQLLADRFAHLGCEETTESMLIGKAPHIGELAWLHAFYRGLSKGEVMDIENRLHQKLPNEIKEFYYQTNGLTLFNTALNLNGIRRISDRNPLNRQPFSLYTGNEDERPDNSKSSFFFFASYGYDLTRVFVDIETSKIYACDRWDAKIIKCTWSNFNLFIESEIYRLINLYDENGVFKSASKKLILPY